MVVVLAAAGSASVVNEVSVEVGIDRDLSTSTNVDIVKFGYFCPS